MTDAQLRRLSRRDLIDIIFELKKREMQLQQQLEEANKALEDRQIRIEQAGSIAQAALALNRVFEAAQAAADDYLRSVRGGVPEDVDTLLAETKKLVEE